MSWVEWLSLALSIVAVLGAATAWGYAVLCRRNYRVARATWDRGGLRRRPSNGMHNHQMTPVSGFVTRWR